jgi:hypothetical protein
MIEYLLRKCELLNSSPSTKEKKGGGGLWEINKIYKSEIHNGYVLMPVLNKHIHSLDFVHLWKIPFGRNQ